MPEPVLLSEQEGAVLWLTLNRPRYRNAINVALITALDQALVKAAADDGIAAVVIGAAGPHFCSGHDLGSPGRDLEKPFRRVATTWYDHSDKEGAEAILVREDEAYLAVPLRWREHPKPLIAMVQGACVAGGLSLIWPCDLIVASDDAYFADPVVRMGIPGIEYFAHQFVMSTRIAREFLLLGDRMSATRAYEVGMVNRVVPRHRLRETTALLAERCASRPRFGVALAKRTLNGVEDRMGLRDGMSLAFGLHQVAHAHNALTSEDHVGGQDPRSIARDLASE